MRKVILLGLLAVPVIVVLFWAFAEQKPAPKYEVGYDFGFGKIESRKLVWGGRFGRQVPHYHWTYTVLLDGSTMPLHVPEDWPRFTQPLPATSETVCPGRPSPDASDSSEKSEGSARNR